MTVRFLAMTFCGLFSVSTWLSVDSKGQSRDFKFVMWKLVVYIFLRYHMKVDNVFSRVICNF